MASGEWFLIIDGQRQGPLDLDALLAALLSQPQPETEMVWRRGYPSWKPAGEVPELAAELPPPAPTRKPSVPSAKVAPLVPPAPLGQAAPKQTAAPSSTQTPARPTVREGSQLAEPGGGLSRSGLAAWVIGFLWVQVALAAIAFLICAAFLNRPTPEAWNALVNVEVFQVLAFFVTGVLFLVWQYRTGVNVRAQGGQLSNSPLWTVVVWFVPFLCFVGPYRAVADLWDASSAREEHRTSALVGWWWACWLLMLVAETALRTQAGAAKVADDVISVVWLGLARDGLLIAAAVLLATIVRDVRTGLAAQTFVGGSRGVPQTPPALRSILGLRENVFWLGGRDNIERNVLACVFWFSAIVLFLRSGLIEALLGGALNAALTCGALRLFRLVSRKIGARRSLVAGIDTLRQSRLDVPSEPSAPQPSADVPAAPQQPAPVPEPPTEPPPIQAQCPWCGVRGRIGWHRRTEVVRCPACQHGFRLGTESGGAIKVDPSPPSPPETNARGASPFVLAAPAPLAEGTTAQPPRQQSNSAAGWLPAGLIGIFAITAIIVVLTDERSRQSGTQAAAGAGAVQPATNAPAMVGRPAETDGAAADRSMEDARRGYREGSLVSKDLPEAAQAYQRACDGGDAAGCSSLGVLYYSGHGVSKDATKAAELYRKACDGGDSSGCSSLGVLYANGEGVPKDATKAAGLYQKACDAGSAIGCYSLGVLCYNGEGVPQDTAKAAQLHQKACDAGSADGCNNLGVLYADGEGLTKNAAKASQLYQKACDGGSAVGCYNLGLHYYVGEGVSKSTATAAQLLQKACDGGVAEACRK